MVTVDERDSEASKTVRRRCVVGDWLAEDEKRYAWFWKSTDTMSRIAQHDAIVDAAVDGRPFGLTAMKDHINDSCVCGVPIEQADKIVSSVATVEAVGDNYTLAVHEPKSIEDILKECRIDPDRYEIVGEVTVRSRELQSGDVVYTYGFKVRERTRDLDKDWLAGFVQGKPKVKTTYVDVDESAPWFVFQAGDLQLGKRSSAGSTDEILERYWESVNSAIERIADCGERGLDIGGIQLCFPGDCLEGSQSQGGKNVWLTQETITEQTRIFRRLLMVTVDRFAHLANNVYVDVVNGNHDCLSDDTRCVTKRGFVESGDLRMDDLVMSVDDAGRTIWLPIERIIRREHKGDMYHLSTRGADMLVTPNHRVVGLSMRSGNWIEHDGEDVADATAFRLVRAGQNTNPDAAISDDELRLYAWCLTDSHKTDRGYWSFYQRESAASRITDLLDRLGLTYTTSTRLRDIAEICGKRLKASPEPEVTVRIGADQSRRLAWNVDRLDDMVWSLSDRQVSVFLDELIFCDGSQASGGGDSCVLYGNGKDAWWDDLRILLAQSGYRTSLTEARLGDVRMNIHRRATLDVRHPSRIVEKVHYHGDVWCLTVPNGRFFIERNGKIQLTGNCSERRWNTYPGDGWATECALAVKDALTLNEKAYGHVEVRVPDKWAGSMTVPVGDTIVTVAHGHQWPRNKGMTWWAEQALHNQDAKDSQVLQHGHIHTWELEASRDRIRVSSPTFDCGSDWFREKHGAESRRGALTYFLKSGDVYGISLV